MDKLTLFTTSAKGKLFLLGAYGKRRVISLPEEYIMVKVIKCACLSIASFPVSSFMFLPLGFHGETVTEQSTLMVLESVM